MLTIFQATTAFRICKCNQEPRKRFAKAMQALDLHVQDSLQDHKVL